ncbi:hypothetical protein FB45DRAFT_1143401 [Roridomyces roridus]|uniref:F-box domain-containing protein n=1 Tax=Roridomyces roridus TaxID=1738132 RepID=A0AAD7C072_9AGAR|nr:hypothetical protein FB45DRAFT_1143401 [Roridomyces roridus]
MDRKLSQPEILGIIFNFVLTPVTSFSSDSDRPWMTGMVGKSNLASLARTCKTFRDPALDLLWCRQTSLQPALRLFPEDLWVSGEWGRQGFKERRREIVASDWRPVVYFARVRSLVLDDYTMPLSANNLWETLKHLLLRCPTAQLFPNLQDIRWLEQSHPTILPVLEIFSAPRLTSMGFTPGESVEDLTALRNLGTATSDLTDVVIRHTHMAGFEFHFQTDPAEPSVPAFPALEEISGFISPEILIQILSAMGQSRLTSIEADFYTSEGARLPTISTTTALYTAIAEHCSPSNLTTLCIPDNWVDGGAEELVPDEFAFGEYAIGPAALELLKPFTNLTSLTLDTFHGFDIDDDTVLRLARSWSKLEKLSLACIGPGRSPGYWPDVSTLSLEYLAVFCRELRELTLLFDATEIQRLSDVIDFDGSFSQGALKRLNVNFSPILDAGVVTSFLQERFPSLRSVSSGFWLEEDAEERAIWSEVSELFPDRY